MCLCYPHFPILSSLSTIFLLTDMNTLRKNHQTSGSQFPVPSRRMATVCVYEIFQHMLCVCVFKKNKKTLIMNENISVLFQDYLWYHFLKHICSYDGVNTVGIISRDWPADPSVRPCLLYVERFSSTQGREQKPGQKPGIIAEFFWIPVCFWRERLT